MKVFFVSDHNYLQLLRDNKCPLMVSFATVPEQSFNKFVPSGFSEVMIDSGGYQLQTGVRTNRQVAKENYALWLKLALDSHPEISGYMNLDIMGDTKQSLYNLSYLESQGLKPIPVWHAGESDSVLDSYCVNHDYVALGGLVGKGRMRSDTIRHVFERMCLMHPHTRIHVLGLGVTSSSAARSFQPYSVDFSTWTMPFRYGMMFELGDHKIREIKAPASIRDRIRTDRRFKRDFTESQLRLILSFFSVVDELHEPHQVPLF